jgi:DNA-binding transcriptional LysR family regulator
MQKLGVERSFAEGSRNAKNFHLLFLFLNFIPKICFIIPLNEIITLMDRIFALQSLVYVIDEGGFAAAAKKLGVSPPVITRNIAELEAELRTRLLHRTTRSFKLTDDGVGYISRIRAVLADLADADAALAGRSQASFDTIRAAADSMTGQFIVAPAMSTFSTAHPALKAELILLDRRADLASEGHDIIISSRNGLSGTPLAQIPVVMIASPAYCAVRGRPKSPHDLPHHDGLFPSGKTSWIMRDGGEILPRIRGSSNRSDILKAWCLAGLGIAVLPGFLVQREIDRNELIVLLDGFEPKPLTVIAEAQPRSNAGRAFLSHLKNHLRQLRF